MTDRYSLEWSATDFGWVFMGVDPVTEGDLQALRDYTHDAHPDIDDLSLVGRYDREWDCVEPGLQDMGGLGSHTYETQFCGKGVEFKPRRGQEPINHVNPQGEYVRGIIDYPCTKTAFHRDDHHSTVAGPDPDSHAAKLLGDGCYAWDAKNELWLII